ncbi:hypothetical protein J6590_058553 [Homalodisca vitripennis]|nr:hypothetical protein J6590_058553 [Homalodisca vitripennis]
MDDLYCEWERDTAMSSSIRQESCEDKQGLNDAGLRNESNMSSDTGSKGSF